MSPVVKSLPVLVLYPHARCNCRCVMCDIWKETSSAELSADELSRHLADMERLSVKWVVFSGGEPLMHSDLFRLARMLKSKNIRVTLLSTGLLLERRASEIVGNIDDVIVSLDGPPEIHDQIRRIPGAFLKLRAGVARLHAIDEAFVVTARCTVQKQNHAHICRTAEQAYSLGLRSISLLAADLTSEAFNRSSAWNTDRQSEVSLSAVEIDTLERELEELDRRWSGSGFVLESLEKLNRVVRHFRAHLGQCESEAPLCNAPWNSAVVEADGTVRPCFFHKPVGSLKAHTLLEVVNGFEAQRFRSSLDVARDPVCRRCVCSLNLKQTA
jgi:MoaA/NifB/PqqE/SkfB family radical SAM enzyme